MESTGHGHEAEDDNLSVTSTVDLNWPEDEEFTVEDVLIKVNDDGTDTYLIKWENFDLKDATWETGDKLKPSILEMWEERKQEEGDGKIRKFRIKDWVDAQLEEIRGKRARHDRRNQIRRERGIDETDYDTSLSEEEKDPKGWLYYETEDSDDDDDDLPIFRQRRRPKDSNDLQSEAAESPNSSKAKQSPPKKIRRDEQANAAKATPQRPAVPVKRSSLFNLSSRKETEQTSSPRTTTLSSRPAISTSRASAAGNAGSPSSGAQSKPKMRRTNPSKGGPTASRPIGNIFIDGKTPQRRKKLDEKAVDPSTTPQMLKPRYTNLLSKRSRNRDGEVAPAQKPKHLMSLDPNSEDYLQFKPTGSSQSAPERPVVQRKPSSKGHEDTTVEGQVTDQTDTVMTDAPENRQAQDQQPARRGGIIRNKARPLIKRNKSVRFDEPNLESALQNEGSLFMSPEPPVREPTEQRDDPALSSGSQPPPQPKRKTFQEYQQQRHPVDKTRPCTISEAITEPIELTFKSLTVGGHEDWYLDFQEPSVLKFDHLCLAELHRKLSSDPSLYKSQIGRGIVEVPNEAEHLVETVAERLKIGSYGVVWYGALTCVVLFPSKCEAWGGGRASDPPLSYAMYEFAPGHRLPPTTPGTQYREPSIGVRDAITSKNMCPESFFGATYSELVPLSLQQASLDQHSFFLLFPPYAYETEKTLRRWLRYFNPSCAIRTSSASEHWSSFRAAPSGTLILHEGLWKMILLFPGMSELLAVSPKTLSFWRFGRKLPAMDPEADAEENMNISTSDRSFLHQVFMEGDVFLITPSFVDFHPDQFCSFIRWFRATCRNAADTPLRPKLALPTAFNSWYLDLIMGKAGKSNVYREQLDMLSVDHRQATGLQSDQIKRLTSCWDDICKLSDESTGEPVVEWAPSFIDANDEQSLVNWLGKWSIESTNSGRNFFVIGSADFPPSAASAPWRSSKIKVPTFSSELMSALDRVSSSEAHQLDSEFDRMSVKSFLSQLPDETGNYIVIMNWNIVSYWNPEMSLHMGDLREEAFSSFRTWFDLLQPFQKDRRPVRNTYAGFFYTMNCPWDATKYPQGQCGPRYPWFALFRPVNPHRPSWSTSELFIWDPAASRYYGSTGTLELAQLIEPHRQLVTVVDQGCQDNCHPELSHVWIGGFEADKEDAVEATKGNLRDVLLDLKFRLPAPSNKIECRGWRPVVPGRARSPPPQRATSPVPMSLDSDERVFDKAIFPPPSGRDTPGATNTPLSNLLLTETQKAKAAGKEDMDFLFQPTMQWYNKQAQAGRGFTHMRVGPWDKIFKDLDIPSSLS